MSTHPQVEAYTKKVDSFMAKYPNITQYDKLKEIEKNAGYPAAWFFILGCVVLTGLVTLVGGAKLLVDLTGFVYPAYMSFKSIENAGSDVPQWLTYWVVFSFWNLAETFLFFASIIPFYFWLKIAVTVWLWYPTTRGAQTVYEQVLRPALKPYIMEHTGTKME